MVAAKPLQQKELVRVLIFHEMKGDYPDVPISTHVDFEGLVQADREAGESPFFITLPLGEYNQTSRNNRRYVGDTALTAIHDAINSRRITGQRGHTADDRRSWEFRTQVLSWVGATVKDGVVWGKAYVNRTQEGMDLREEYRVAAKTNATVGTSLEGWGYQEWNDETEMWDIYELDVDRIDAVGPAGVGVLKAGSMPPKITSESKKDIKEAALGELQIGDLVSWENDGVLIRGRINTIWESGEVEVPYSEHPPLIATADDPIARMDVYQPSWETGEWVYVGYQDVRHFSQLMKLESLPELKQDTDTEDKEATIEQTDNSTRSEKEGDTDMPEPTQENGSNVEDHITELTATHEAEMTTLQSQLSETQRNARKYAAELKSLREKLGIAEDADVVDGAEAVITERDTLREENKALLETAIEQAISVNSKLINEGLQSDNADVKTFAGAIQTMVKQLVAAESISKKADVEPSVKKVFEQSSVKSMLAGLRVTVMGPSVNTPFSEGDGDSEIEAVTY